MASYRLHVDVVSRGAGQSVIAKAAYNAREALRDDRTGDMKDYSRGSGLEFSGLFLPKDAPEWAKDRAQLWNRVEWREDQQPNKKNRAEAQLARNIELSIPHELNTPELRKQIVRDFVREQFTRQGMIADVAIHAPHPGSDQRNYHAHVLLTMREIENGEFAAKKNRDWNSPELTTHWREKWAELGARYIEKQGYRLEAERYSYSHLTLNEQRKEAERRKDFEHARALDREAQTHQGPHVAAMEKRGIETEIGNAYRDVIARNEQRADLAKTQAELLTLDKKIAALEQQMSEAEQQRGTQPRREAGQGRPEHFGRAAAEASHDEQTARAERLKGEAAKIWDAYRQPDSARNIEAEMKARQRGEPVSIRQKDRASDFAAALDSKGISFAATTKGEAERSHRQAEFAKAIGNYAPRYREGEIVIVTEQRLEYRRNGEAVTPLRVHKLDQSLARKFVDALGTRSQLQGIDATLKASDQRAELRAAQWSEIRLDRARDTKSSARSAGSQNIRQPSAAFGKATLRTVAKLLDFVSRAFDSLFSPVLTPQQQHDAARAVDQREAAADTQRDRQQQESRVAAWQRERDERER